MKFRIVAFPLVSSTLPLSRAAFRSTTPSSSSNDSTNPNSNFRANRQLLYYYHFQTISSTTSTANPPNLLRKAVDKAIGAWNGMGLAPEGNWKRTIYVYGERLMDKIDFEESSLKHLHPPSNFSRTQTLRQPEKEGSSTVPKEITEPITLVYPSNFPSPLSNFSQTIHQRTSLHRRGFWTWLIISPFMAPFAIVPIIPNLPFFFCAWRSYSHYRAYKTSDYLQYLLENGVIRPEPNDEFAGIYSEVSGTVDPAVRVEEKVSNSSSVDSDTGSTTSGDKGVGQEQEQRLGELLLSSSGVSELVQRLKLQDRALGEISKALEQAAARLEKAKTR